MYRLVAITLLIGILTQSLGKVIVLLQYELNKDFISATLCENRDKPEMHCNGKCHLNKELAKEEQRDRKNTLNNNEVHQVLIVQELADGMILLQSDEHLFHPYRISALQSFSQVIFHPPLA